MLSAGSVLVHLSHGITESAQLAPPLLETPTPMPCPPPFDQRSWCHWAIMFSPLTASCGSTSALTKFFPVCVPFGHAARGDGSFDTAVPCASPPMEASRVMPLASAPIHKAFRTNSQSPFQCQPANDISDDLNPSRFFRATTELHRAATPRLFQKAGTNPSRKPRRRQSFGYCQQIFPPAG